MKLFKSITEAVITTVAGIVIAALVTLIVTQYQSTDRIVSAQKKNFSTYLNTPRWEYKMISLKEGAHYIESLNTLGLSGWELIDYYQAPDSTTHVIVILKRRLKID